MAESRVESLVNVVVTKNQEKNSDNNRNYKDAKNNMQSMERSSKNILKNLQNAFKKTALVGWALTIKETTEGLIDLTKKQSEYVENLNLMQVAFGETQKEAEGFINTLSSRLGFDSSTLTRQLGVFRQIGSAMNYDAETADLLSKNLTKMQIDISSLYNTSIEQAGKSLESAITGNVMSIRRLTGADITQATLQQEALARGINKSTREMTRAEKTILIYLTLERQLSNANGDAARTINSVANQTKIFHDQIAMAGRQLSAFFIPILQSVLPILNGILMAFNEILGIILKLFKIDAPSLASQFGTASGGIDIIGDSLDNVAEASDKAKKSLRGFDKLNNITTPDTTESSSPNLSISGGGVGSEFLGALDEYNNKLDEMKNKAEAIKEKIMGWLGFTKNENGEWEWSAKLLKDNILKALKNIWEWLVKNWKLVLIIAGVIAGFIILKKKLNLGSALKNTSKALKSVAKGFEILAIGVAGLMILGGLAMVIHEINELLKTMSENSIEVKDVLILVGGVLAEVVIAVGLLVLALKQMDWQSIAGGVVILGGLALILLTLTGLIKTIGELGMSTSDVLILVGGLLAELLISMGILIALSKVISSDPLVLVGILALVGAISVILLVMKETIPVILDAISKFIVKIAPIVIELLRTIGNIIGNIIHELGVSLPPIIDSVGKLFTRVFDGISKVVETVGNAIVNILDAVKRLIIDVLDAIIKFINDAGPAINRFVDNIIEAVTKVINFVISGVEYLINTLIIGAINGLLKAINVIPGVDIDLIENVHIPRFTPELRADGGFVDSGDIFIANENNKPEYVGSFGNRTAVANTDQIVDGISIGVARAMASVKPTTDVNIVAKGDTSGLLNFIEFEQQKKNRQFGL